MRAVVMTEGGGPEVLRLQDVDTPVPGPGDALVSLRAAGLNHRDVWQRRGYGGTGPMVLGSDGAGVVQAVGDTAHEGWVGTEVVINPGLYWGDREDAGSRDFQILGVPSWGTYAEAVRVPVANLLPKPEHLDFLQAAALPLAGLTAWRALFTQGRLAPGETVFLPGIGSGVAGLALLLAKRAGARVLVSSSSAEKLARARDQGADGGVNYTDADWEHQMQALAGPDGIDLVLDHSGAQTVPRAVGLIRPGGRIVFLGATTGAEAALNLRAAWQRQAHLVGTYMGSPREFAALFRFVRHHRLTPEVLHVFPLAQAADAHALMEAGGQYGKIMLTME